MYIRTYNHHHERIRYSIERIVIQSQLAPIQLVVIIHIFIESGS